MSSFSIVNHKIDPTRVAKALKPDGSIDDDDRVEIGPTDVAFAEWAALGLTTPNLDRMRKTRLGRIVQQLRQRHYAGVLCFDPLNIRYASDSSNMHIWIMHNPSRAVFVSADGYVVLWDFHRCGHLSTYLPLINEIRDGGAGFYYFVAGDEEEAIARDFAGQIDELLRRSGGKNRRLAVDKIEIPGLRALDAVGIEVCNGMQLMEHARAIKGIDEINAMRCSLATCEIAVAKMRERLQPGIAETELWSALHAENIARGGEWIETRILTSGPRTNPWMQEAGPRRIVSGDLVAFDTDMVGPYGMCADFSRTWHCGDGRPTDEQRRLHAIAYEHIAANMAMLKPGVSFTELTQRSHKLPPEFVKQRYGVMMHGIGLCDEYPAILYPEDFIPGAFDYVLEPGMTLCVEAYIGAVGGREGVKLEEQVLVTENGVENLTRCPFDEALMA
ncbi:Xaa-Pro peptidase family protein [Mesorhizobium sp.]|uniref:M24 family metallopeptidase n=1 Tax=Mesorhizobium sp. TaxID=1871066 RepID=UPI000FE5C289|nr:Xaa-Pro peptidase family protein [Mesorhizobium sp.]RWB65984.1 MAG: aminopeptidase P family protein [Mesorhizobium sp.]RWF26093.1 MAG: aminopeptidase P family protein [Mesorhizobium sp.]TIT10755.1 MAG: aminopeptidase P family protein [Mesorhizobium sp.]TIV82852.1 MAG: aminopeptidase P family protein [Mesorhizobium sp.]